MLYLIGTGLGPSQLTHEAMDAIKQCDSLFIEDYTNAFSKEDEVYPIITLANKPVQRLARHALENDLETFVASASKRTVGLLVIGNPLFATTHAQLLLEATRQKIPVQIITGISIQNYLGHTGLDPYKFGRIVTIVFPTPQFAPESFFDQLAQNLAHGYHTLCLLDIQRDQNRLMTIPQAIARLHEIAEKRQSRLLKHRIGIGLYAMGSTVEKIRVFKLDHPPVQPAGVFPQSLVICGTLNAKEQELLQTLYKAPAAIFSPASKQTIQTLAQRVQDYRTRTQQALDTIVLAQPLSDSNKQIADDFLDMARNYFADAVFFEQRGELATALAAYSYAHAWLDAGVRARVLDAKGNDRLFTLPANQK